MFGGYCCRLQLLLQHSGLLLPLLLLPTLLLLLKQQSCSSSSCYSGSLTTAPAAHGGRGVRRWCLCVPSVRCKPTTSLRAPCLLLLSAAHHPPAKPCCMSPALPHLHEAGAAWQRGSTHPPHPAVHIHIHLQYNQRIIIYLYQPALVLVECFMCISLPMVYYYCAAAVRAGGSCSLQRRYCSCRHGAVTVVVAVSACKCCMVRTCSCTGTAKLTAAHPPSSSRLQQKERLTGAAKRTSLTCSAKVLNLNLLGPRGLRTALLSSSESDMCHQPV